jgi:hypothetical protein
LDVGREAKNSSPSKKKKKKKNSSLHRASDFKIWKSPKGRDHSEELDIDGRIMLELILGK